MPSVIPDSLEFTSASRVRGALPVGTSPAFDFDEGEFVLNGSGDLALIHGDNNIQQWIRKAIGTARFKHLIYSRSFGSEWESYAARLTSPRGARAIISELIRDALLRHDRIVDVHMINIVRTGTDYLEVSMKVILDDSKRIQFQTQLAGF